MKKVLIIDSSYILRKYLLKLLPRSNFSVEAASDGLDGSRKLRFGRPDIVIMEYYLYRKSGLELLREKISDPNGSNPPVILMSKDINRQLVIDVAPYGVRKILKKPFHFEVLIEAISSILQVEIKSDRTPCKMDLSLVEGILFVEISEGINTETLGLFQFKAAELLKLYKVSSFRILLHIENVKLDEGDLRKLDVLLWDMQKFTDSFTYTAVQTTDIEVSEYLSSHKDFSSIQVVATLDESISYLLGRQEVRRVKESYAKAKGQDLWEGSPIQIN